MRALTSKNGDLNFHFHQIDESQAETKNRSLKDLLVNNHDVATNKGKLKGQLPIEHFFDIVKHLERN